MTGSAVRDADEPPKDTRVLLKPVRLGELLEILKAELVA
jgi:hypothetical protein